MNYPVWDVFIGSGLLIAIVSVVHVFISHFAVGGGLFLVVTEQHGLATGDQPMLQWLRKHTKFFVLLTVVMGAVTGVGIWFTVGLNTPAGTSTLIHSFVWGWAIEWVFFFLEITAALLYLYGWDKLERKTHLFLGWVYFAAAFASMVIINGIITFMLTPGTWLVTHGFWDGFFNPTYWPSLFIRFAFSIVLAGMYALLTAAFVRDREVKARLVKWCARWVVPCFVALPLIGLWYVRAIPAETAAAMSGRINLATFYATLTGAASVATLALFGLVMLRPGRLTLVLSVLPMAGAFVMMWGFETIRESLRKPYIIQDYQYITQVYAAGSEGPGVVTYADIGKDGVLATARWSKYAGVEITPENRVDVGCDVFRLQCLQCHTPYRFRSMADKLVEKQWRRETLSEMLDRLQHMQNGVMPPFNGTPQEKEALMAYLESLVPAPAPEKMTGGELFASRCGSCHWITLKDPVVRFWHGLDTEAVSNRIANLEGVFSGMPPFTGTPQEQGILAEWISETLAEQNE